MADASKDVTKVDPDLSLPAHLQDQQVQGMDDLKDYIQPPLLKIVQKQATQDYAMFDPGDLIINPAKALVAKHNKGTPESFLFVPIFFYSEVCTWAPLELRGQVPAILGRTMDKTSDAYKKALNSDTWEEEVQWEDRKIKARHVEHLNFVVMLMGDHPLAGEPMIMSFSKGEFKTGRRFANMIKARRTSPFNCVFEARVSPEQRVNNKGAWFGFDIENPKEAEPWVSAETSAKFQEIYEGFAGHKQSGTIRTQYDDAEGESAASHASDDEI